MAANHASRPVDASRMSGRTGFPKKVVLSGGQILQMKNPADPVLAVLLAGRLCVVRRAALSVALPFAAGRPDGLQA